jgi:hypothetical protein
MPETNHAGVRYDRRDATMGLVVWFGALLTAGLIVVNLVLYPFLHSLESRERAEQESRRPPLPAEIRADRPRFPDQLEAIRKNNGTPLQVADFRDLQALRDREDSVLQTYSWEDRKAGKVRIPIEAALKLIEDPETATRHGIVARAPKEAK